MQNNGKENGNDYNGVYRILDPKRDVKGVGFQGQGLRVYSYTVKGC